MKKAIWTAVAVVSGLAALGWCGWWGWLAVSRAPRDIPVLMYHNVLREGELSVWQVSEEEFERQMGQLEEAGYEAVLPDDIERAWRGLKRLPKKPVVITFDDGYEGVATYAEPILARHGLKGMCYAVAGLLAEDGEERATFDSGPILTSAEARAMAERGVVALGSHSLTHQRNPKGLAAEMGPSKSELRRRTGVKTRAYCYPYGMHGQDYMYEGLRGNRFRTALACGDEMFHYGRETNLLAIPRLSVYGGVHNIRVEAVRPEDGVVLLKNEGKRIPLKVRVTDGREGREWESGTEWVGGGEATAYRFPPEALSGERRIEAWDKAGLFRYVP